VEGLLLIDDEVDIFSSYRFLSFEQGDDDDDECEKFVGGNE